MGREVRERLFEICSLYVREECLGFGLTPDLCLHWPCGGERTEGRRTRDTRFRKQHGCSTVGSLPSEVTGGFFRPRKGANGLMAHGPLHGGSGIVSNCMELFPDSKIEFGNQTVSTAG